MFGESQGTNVLPHDDGGHRSCDPRIQPLGRPSGLLPEGSPDSSGTPTSVYSGSFRVGQGGPELYEAGWDNPGPAGGDMLHSMGRKDGR